MRHFTKVAFRLKTVIQPRKNTFFWRSDIFWQSVAFWRSDVFWQSVASWRSDSLPMSHWSSDAFLRADNKLPWWWGDVSMRHYFGEVTPTLENFCTMTDEFLSMGPGFFVFFSSFLVFVLIDNFHRLIIFSSQLFRYDTFTDWGLFWLKILQEIRLRKNRFSSQALLVHKRSKISISPSACFLTSHFA